MNRKKRADRCRPHGLFRCTGHVENSIPAARKVSLSILATMLAITCGMAEPARAAPILKVLYSFRDIRGIGPEAGLIEGDAGRFYGTASSGGANNGGVVFELDKPPAGQTVWTETVLFSFYGTNVSQQVSSLIADRAGNLYGTTGYGGPQNAGEVFELSPPVAGKTAWTEKVLVSFGETISGGSYPLGGVIADHAGNLYGTTSEGGTNSDGIVYELSPPVAGQTAWTETVLQTFDSTNGKFPAAGLLADGAGNFYGTTPSGGEYGEGEVYELSPPVAGQMAWTETVLFSFNGNIGYEPLSGLIADGAGNLFGTTYEGEGNFGEVFELSPPVEGKKAWTETVLQFFHGVNGSYPLSGLIADHAGNLYGTTSEGGMHSDGIVYELSPPVAGHKAWTETVLHTFSGTKGKYPIAGLMIDHAGNFFGTTFYGGETGDGIAFKLTP